MKWILPEGSAIHSETSVAVKLAKKCYMHFELEGNHLKARFSPEFRVKWDIVDTTLVVQCTYVQSSIVPAYLASATLPVPDEITAIEFRASYTGYEGTSDSDTD